MQSSERASAASESMPSWLTSLPDSVVAVTGATAGIGYFIAEQLAATGAKVVLLGRSKARLAQAVASITQHVPHARLDTLEVNLASLESARRAGQVLAGLPRLDGLIENAGVIPGTTKTPLTEDGFEIMFGTNHLGHFALAGHAFPALARTPGSRIVTAGSATTRVFGPTWDEIKGRSFLTPWRRYAQSKHATQVFAFELDRRLRARKVDVGAMVADPGGGLDGLTPVRKGILETSRGTRLIHRVQGWLGFAQGKDACARVFVRAALDKQLASGSYIAPAKGSRGAPVPKPPPKESSDTALGQRLWEFSEARTGVRFEL